jgi:hypothetical protein
MMKLIPVLALFVGCVNNHQFRTSLESCRTIELAQSCQTATLEETKDYLLGFVEFDDQGWLWNRKQMTTVLNQLYAEDNKQGLLMLVFVHGWKHNASYEDGNVEMFRTNLTILGRLERLASRKEGRPPRKVVGVYAGWRGLSQNIWGLNNTTFWERKNTAHEVGRGSLTELLVRLEDIRNNSRILHKGETGRKSTQLVVIGHSFGGAATFSALAPLLVERMIETINLEGEAHPSRGFGDLVVLINPAFEAARYAVLQNIAHEMENGFFTNQPVNLAIFTSKSDNATKVAFPIGRMVSTVFNQYQSKFEKRANITAVGHFQPFITHDLIALDKSIVVDTTPGLMDEKEIEASAERVVSVKRQLHSVAPKYSVRIGHALLQPRDTNYPFMPLFVVAVDPKIIPDHNTIDNKAFLKFLSEFLLEYSGE